MKIIDLSPVQANSRPGKPQRSDWLSRLQMILRYGWGWYQSYQAQNKVLRVLRQVLDQRFVAIRGLKPAGSEAPLPPILIGPPGIYLLYVWPKPGAYRIREDQWEVMQGKSRRYRPGKPNIIQEILQLQRQVEGFFSDAMGAPVAVTPLLIFDDSGADVASVRPKVRPLLLDGLKRYGAQLNKAKGVFTPTDLMALVDAANPRAPLAKKQRKTSRARRMPTQAPQQMERAARYLSFTPRQWVILGVLAFAVLVVLTIAIVYVLMTAH